MLAPPSSFSPAGHLNGWVVHPLVFSFNRKESLVVVSPAFSFGTKVSLVLLPLVPLLALLLFSSSRMLFFSRYGRARALISFQAS